MWDLDGIVVWVGLVILLGLLALIPDWSEIFENLVRVHAYQMGWRG